MNSVPNDNLEKLRELTRQIVEDSDKENEYKHILANLKDIVSISKTRLSSAKTNKDKITCYESMCQTITKILHNLDIK
jgi:predicted YcjX-like family ATPase